MDDKLARLELAYADAIEAFSQASKELGMLRITGAKIDYDAAFRAMVVARDAMTDARLNLENYVETTP